MAVWLCQFLLWLTCGSRMREEGRVTSVKRFVLMCNSDRLNFFIGPDVFEQRNRYAA